LPDVKDGFLNIFGFGFFYFNPFVPWQLFINNSPVIMMSLLALNAPLFILRL